MSTMKSPPETMADLSKISVPAVASSGKSAASSLALEGMSLGLSDRMVGVDQGTPNADGMMYAPLAPPVEKGMHSFDLSLFQPNIHVQKYLTCHFCYHSTASEDARGNAAAQYPDMLNNESWMEHIDKNLQN